MRHWLILILLLFVAGFALITWFSAPRFMIAEQLPEHFPDEENGRRLFYAGGCGSCHSEPGAKGDQKLLLGGGLVLKTPFGNFSAPNISPDPDHGLGTWTEIEFINAMQYGTSPQKEHYYPAFPYTSYTNMTVPDLIDLKSFLDTLEPVDKADEPHELSFPFNVRRVLGLWKLLFLKQGFVQSTGTGEDELWARGRYLVEGPGHCAECHTPRWIIGGLRKNLWLSGAQNPDGEGVIPNITPHAQGIGDWSEEEIADYLETGFTPEFDSVGGSMVSVVDNLSNLPKIDLKAIAVYIKSLEPLENSHE